MSLNFFLFYSIKLKKKKVQKSTEYKKVIIHQKLKKKKNKTENKQSWRIYYITSRCFVYNTFQDFSKSDILNLS